MIKKIQVTIPAQTFQIDIEIDGVTPPVDPPTDPPAPPVQTDFIIGSNGFPWFPLHLIKSVGINWMRCYFATGWGYEPDGLSMQPLNQAWTNETNGMDDLLLRAQTMGMKILWCNHQTAEWWLNTGRGDGNNDNAPVQKGQKRDDPNSYKWYAEYFWQLVARYGKIKYADNLLRVDSSPRWPGDENFKKSGLGLLEYVEPWNEPEKWWKQNTSESDSYFKPEETAAMMSAVYDGHEGVLGQYAGIKTADPSMVVVMPGLTDYDFPYIAALDAWFKANRKDKKWPCDVFNLHHYSNIGNKPKQHPAQWKVSGGCYPSEDQNFDTVKELIAFAKSIGKKFWLSEFGYDTAPTSNMHIVGKNGKSSEVAQGEALVESIKKYKEYGADGVFFFTGPDDIGSGQFTKSGIFTKQSDGYKPKQSVPIIKAYIESLKPPQMMREDFSFSAANFKRPQKLQNRE